MTARDSARSPTTSHAWPEVQPVTKAFRKTTQYWHVHQRWACDTNNLRHAIHLFCRAESVPLRLGRDLRSASSQRTRAMPMLAPARSSAQNYLQNVDRSHPSRRRAHPDINSNMILDFAQKYEPHLFFHLKTRLESLPKKHSVRRRYIKPISSPFGLERVLPESAFPATKHDRSSLSFRLV